MLQEMRCAISALHKAIWLPCYTFMRPEKVAMRLDMVGN